MRRNGYKDITVSYENWRKIMQIKLDSKSRSADAVFTRILEVYAATKTAYKRSPKLIRLISEINDNWIYEKELEADRILRQWGEK